MNNDLVLLADGPLIDAERQRLAQGGVAGGEWFDDYKDRDAVIGPAFQPASGRSSPEYGREFARIRPKILEKSLAAGRGNR